MGKIAWGLIFLFFDLNINHISITPAFVGYILIALGMKEYGSCPVTRGGETCGWVSAVLAFLLWIPVAFFGRTALALVLTGLQLVVTWQIVELVHQMETRLDKDLNWEGLRWIWRIMAVLQGSNAVLSIIAVYVGEYGVAVALAVATLVSAVCFTVAFWRRKRLAFG